DADRAKWDYHPMMAMAGSGKAGQGRFYQMAPSKDFRGMVALMKNYVRTRAAWIDANLLSDAAIPATPTIARTGTNSLGGNTLTFHCSEFKGPGTFAAMKWRVGEISSSSA